MLWEYQRHEITRSKIYNYDISLIVFGALCEIVVLSAYSPIYCVKAHWLPTTEVLAERVRKLAGKMGYVYVFVTRNFILNPTSYLTLINRRWTSVHLLEVLRRMWFAKYFLGFLWRICYLCMPNEQVFVWVIRCIIDNRCDFQYSINALKWVC